MTDVNRILDKVFNHKNKRKVSKKKINSFSRRFKK